MANTSNPAELQAKFEELAKETEGKALALKDKFVAIIDTDTEAFNAVSAVFTMPKDTDEEKAAAKAKADQEKFDAAVAAAVAKALAEREKAEQPEQAEPAKKGRKPAKEQESE